MDDHQTAAARYFRRWLDAGPLVPVEADDDEQREAIRAAAGRTTTTENNATFLRFIRGGYWLEFRNWFCHEAERQIRDNSPPFVVVNRDVEASLWTSFVAERQRWREGAA